MKSKILRRHLLSILFITGLTFILTLLIVVSKKNVSFLSQIDSDKNKVLMSYHTNLIKHTKDNKDFRRVLFTGLNSQLVIMSIPPGGEVGKETHKYTEQALFFLSGTGEAEINGEKFPIVAGDVFVIVPGAEHNFRNTGKEDIKIYTLYAPPNHIDGRVHHTKKDADADIKDEAVGESAPLK